MLNPGHDRPVIETDGELHSHFDLALLPLDESDEVRRLMAERHEIDHGERAGLCLELGFEHECAVAVPACRACWRSGWGNLPPAVLGCTQKGGEAGGRVEVGKAQPVDRAIAAHKGRGLAVAHETVIFDATT